jgi:hypothetical protein
MALQKQVVPIIWKGLDTKTAPAISVPGTLVTLENAFQQKSGTFQKRNGVTSLVTTISSGSSITSGNKLAAFENETVLSMIGSLFSYSSADAKWYYRGSHSAMTVETKSAVSDVNAQAVPDCAYASGLTFVVFEDARGVTYNGIYYAVIDETSGQRIIAKTLISSTGRRPKIAQVGSSMVIFYAVGNDLRAKKVALATPGTLSGESTVATDLHSDDVYDVQRNTASNLIAVAYRTITPSTKVLYWNESMAVATAAVDHAYDPDNTLSWLHHDFSNSSIYLAYAETGPGGVRVQTLNSTTLAETAMETIEAGVDSRNVAGYVDLPAKIVYYDIHNGTPDLYRTKRGVYNGSATLDDVARSVGVGSRVFKLDGRYFVNLLYTGTTGLLSDAYQGMLMVWDATGFQWAAKALAGLGAGIVARNELPTVATISSTKAVAVTLKRNSLEIETGSYALGNNAAALVYLNQNDSRLGGPKVIGDSLYWPGGLVRQYDGRIAVEAGFHHYPQQPTHAESAGGALTNLGVYQYCIVYEWFDNQGRLHRSAPSIARTFTLTAGNNTLTLTMPTLRLTERSNVQYGIYRTVAGGSIFYKVSSNTSPPMSTHTGDSINYVDDDADSTITGNEILYTDGGALDNIGPPACRVMEVWKGRLFLAGLSDDPNEIWVSNEVTPYNGVAWSDVTPFRVDAEDGGITAMGAMDDKLVVFKANSIYVLVGDGPNNLGQDLYLPPQRLSIAVGTVEPESVVRTPEGLMFKSTKGIYLLTRGLEAVYIGAQVDEYNSLNVSGAVVIDDQNQVRFTTTGGRTLVWDWYHKQWYTFTNQAAVSAAMVRGVFHYVTSAGVVKYEVSGQFNDDGTSIASTLKLAPIAVAGINGFQRIYGVQILGEYVGAHTLRVKLAYDNSSSDTDTLTVVTASGTYRYEARPSQQRCAAIGITIDDVLTGSGSGGAKWTELSLLVGLKGKLRPTASGSRLT